jgi:hypothetical protein
MLANWKAVHGAALVLLATTSGTWGYCGMGPLPSCQGQQGSEFEKMIDVRAEKHGEWYTFRDLPTNCENGVKLLDERGAPLAGRLVAAYATDVHWSSDKGKTWITSCAGLEDQTAENTSLIPGRAPGQIVLYKFRPGTPSDRRSRDNSRNAALRKEACSFAGPPYDYAKSKPPPPHHPPSIPMPPGTPTIDTTRQWGPPGGQFSPTLSNFGESSGPIYANVNDRQGDPGYSDNYGCFTLHMTIGN